MSPYRTLLALGAVVVSCALTAGALAAPPGLAGSALRARQADGPEARILILGSPHMARSDREWSPEGVRRIQEALEVYRPDMVVVEHLPPGWPKGRGRDYRPGFDLSAYAGRWRMTFGTDAGSPTAHPDTDASPASAVQRPVRATPSGKAAPIESAADPCLRARRHFLRRDLANAAYEWLTPGVDCAAEEEPRIAEWLDRWRQHEMVRIAFPVARASGLGGVVSFDYQGDDARWFLDPAFLEEVGDQGTPEQRAEADSVWAAVIRFREEAARDEEGSLLQLLRARNSREWIEAQRRLYEDVLPRLSYQDAGARQTENYWLRNRRMFDRIEGAAAERGAERILVVVGAGHKYFLDELARERGYRWVDPLKYVGGRSAR